MGIFSRLLQRGQDQGRERSDDTEQGEESGVARRSDETSDEPTNDVRAPDGQPSAAPAERSVEVELGDALESLGREVEIEAKAKARAASPPPEPIAPERPIEPAPAPVAQARAADLLSTAPLRIGGVLVVPT